jgi:hypothetical protein
MLDAEGKTQEKGNKSILAGARCYGPPERRFLIRCVALA